MEIRPLYFDRGTNEIKEAKLGDAIFNGIPINSVVEEYATLFQDTEVNTCCAIVDYTAIPITSNNLPSLTFRIDPYVDCVTLEAGLAGQRVRVALIHGKNYTLAQAIIPSTTDILYLGQDAKLTVIPPSLDNGDRWSVIVGRLVNFTEFIFDPLTPIDFTQGSSGGGNLPPIAGNPATWLFTDGANILWKKLSASDLTPEFAINNFSCSTENLELGQSVSSPHFSASYNSTVSSARLKDSVLNSWQALASPYQSFNSPGTFSKTTASSIIFTLEAHRLDGTVKTASSIINWLPRKFWGTGAAGISIDQLQNNVLSNSYSQVFTVNATSNEYIYLAIPSSFGSPTFSVGSLEGGFRLFQSNISITNSYGVTILYDLWKSDNHSLGTTTVNVS
jgi:hypothetical protein